MTDVILFGTLVSQGYRLQLFRMLREQLQLETKQAGGHAFHCLWESKPVKV